MYICQGVGDKLTHCRHRYAELAVMGAIRQVPARGVSTGQRAPSSNRAGIHLVTALDQSCRDVRQSSAQPLQQPNLEVGSGGDRLTRQPAKQEENIKNALGGNRLTEGIEHDSHNHGDPPMGRALLTRRVDGMLQDWREEGGPP